MKKIIVGICKKIVGNGEDAYLLVSTKTDYGEYSGFYHPPGGKVEDDDQDEVEALKREFMEELSVEVEPGEIIAKTPGDVETWEVTWIACELTSEEFMLKEDEIAEVGFFTKAQMQKMNIWPATKKFFEEYIF